MAKISGIKQLKNGCYEVRIQVKNKYLNINTSKRLDDNGQPFKTKKAAAAYREEYIKRAMETDNGQQPIHKYTLNDVYELYMRTTANEKAPATIRKQDSMWNNHIKPKFGARPLASITLNDLQAYLVDLYTYGDEYNPGANYSFKYVEGFLKFFYLLFSVAYSADMISNEKYTKMFLERSTRLKMPKITQEDAETYKNIKVYTDAELQQLDAIFKRGNCYTAFLLGIYCGLRISEVFALTWADFNEKKKTITVNKQLLYEDGIWCLCPVKTLQAVRVVDLPPVMFKHLQQKYKEHQSNNVKMIIGDLESYRNYEYVIDKTKKQHIKLQGHNFINRKENGELLTPNSIKYWSKAIKAETRIDFKFHSLRKTHITKMANLATPPLLLQARCGHKKFETTMAYYINENALARDVLKKNLQMLDFTNDKLV